MPKILSQKTELKLQEYVKQIYSERKTDRWINCIRIRCYNKGPITYDQTILTHHIQQTKVGEAGDGTAIGLAIATGVNRLENAKATSKVLILITDGVNNAGQVILFQRQDSPKKRHKVYHWYWYKKRGRQFQFTTQPMGNGMLVTQMER